jgi:amino acid adenylation domain-containing protein
MSELSARLARLSPEQRQRVLNEWQTRQRGDAASSPIARIAKDGGDYPLSFAQERLWFLDQLTPGSPFYNISSAQRIPFAVNPAVLDRALSELVRRHGALRTIFPVVEGEPVQRLLHPAPVRCAFLDLGSMPGPVRDAEVQRIAAEAAQQPFDLEAGPVFRATLVRMGPFESAFLFVVHHIVADSVSMDIVFRELGILYADEAAGRAPLLRDEPPQYADFAVWQRNWMSGERLTSELAYWQQQLDGLGTLDLPTDRPRPPVQTHRGAHLDVRVSAHARGRLYAIARESSVTPFMLLLTAFYVLLQRYTQQDDLAVGVPIANRTRRELEGVVGFFANSLVMRADLSGNPTFRTALGRVREVALDAYSHQDVPFSAVVASLHLPQDLSRNPLYQVSFQLITQSGSRDGSTNAEVAFERGGAIFDVVLNLWEAGDELRGQLEYNTDLFDRETAERVVRHYLTLLDSVAANPDLPTASLELLTSEERQRMLVDWNATESKFPDCTLHALVEDQAQRTPDAIALQKGTRTLTYAELDAQASTLARRLRQLAPRRGAIGVMLPASFDMMVAVLGILKSGNGYVPLDPSTPSGRLGRMLDDAAVELVITSTELSGRVPDGHRALAIDADRWTTVALDPPGPDSECTASDLAYIIFTSGSTGTPKGVMVPHRGVVNYLTWCRTFYPIGMGAPLCSPLWSDMSITALFLPLICGSSVMLLDQDDVVEALDSALRSGPTFGFVKLTPSHLEALRSLSLGRDAPRNTAAFIVGGEALQAETLSLWREQAPEVLVFNEYGPTETVVGCAVHTVRAGDLGQGPVPIGKPIANTKLYVLDRYGQPLPVGVPGELHIAGAGVASGYLGARALTEERFLPDPFSPGRVYRTGDLVRYRADGTLEFLGRLDGQFKIRGFRIEPGDVEAAIRRHPAVGDAVVAARDLGTGDRRLIGYIAAARAEPERSALVQELRELLRGELPAYMVPSTFLVVDAIPLTATGKVDMRALEKAAVPEQVRQGPPVPPATALERVIASVIESVLGRVSISANDHFFSDLGGHSLLATKVVARLRDLLRFELPLRWMFEAPTVKDLAVVIAADPQSGAAIERVAGMVLAVLDMSDEQVSRELSSPAGDEREPVSESTLDLGSSPCA